MQYVNWLLWRVYYFFFPPQGLDDWLKHVKRTRTPWWKFKPAVYVEPGRYKEIMWSEESSHCRPGRLLEVDLYVGEGSEGVVGLMIRDAALERCLKGETFTYMNPGWIICSRKTNEVLDSRIYVDKGEALVASKDIEGTTLILSCALPPGLQKKKKEVDFVDRLDWHIEHSRKGEAGSSKEQHVDFSDCPKGHLPDFSDLPKGHLPDFSDCPSMNVEEFIELLREHIKKINLGGDNES